MDELWGRIEAWLAANAPAVAAGLNPPASAEAIVETERFLGVEFPDDVRASYLRHDGQDELTPDLFDGWGWLPLESVRSQWELWKDLTDGGEFDGIESDADGLRVRKGWWNVGWIPLTHNGCGDNQCIDMTPGPQGKLGQVIEMWHDDGGRPVRASDFYEWLADFADSLEAGEVNYG